MSENTGQKTVSKITGTIADWGLYQKSLLFAEIAMIAYLDEKEAYAEAEKMGFTDMEYMDIDGAQAYVFSNDVDVVVACRGTEPKEFNDIQADLKVFPVLSETVGRVHRGFRKEVDDLWPVLEEKLIENEKKLWLCGHSLGAAMATICASRCRLSQINSNPVGLFTYGSPRTGTKKYVSHCVVNHTRWVNNNDIVTRVPAPWMGYRHVGNEMYLNAYGKVRKINGFQRAKDRLRGFIMGIKEGEVDHFSDHSIVRYVEYIQNAFLESEENNAAS